MHFQDRSGGSPDYLADQSRRFMDAARKRPEIGRINTLYRATVPQIYADIDRSKVLKSGVELNDVNTTLGALLGSSYVNDFNRFGRVYKVYLQAEPAFLRRSRQLGLFFVRNAGGGMVPLDSLLTTRPAPDLSSPIASICSARPSSLASRRQAIRQRRRSMRSKRLRREVLPPDMSFDWADMSYQERKAPGVAVVFLLAIFLVFLILLRSTRAGVCRSAFSWARRSRLSAPISVSGSHARTLGPSYVNNIFAQIGLIMLIGLAAKNAILIVEFAKMEFDQGKALVDAALSAAKLRFRPILMTAFAFILGVVPLLTASGAGAEARKVMGTTVFSGMLVVTILGVLLVPMLYVAVEKVIGG